MNLDDSLLRKEDRLAAFISEFKFTDGWPGAWCKIGESVSGPGGRRWGTPMVVFRRGALRVKVPDGADAGAGFPPDRLGVPGDVALERANTSIGTSFCIDALFVAAEKCFWLSAWYFGRMEPRSLVTNPVVVST